MLLDVAFRQSDATLLPDLTRAGARVVVLVDHGTDEGVLHQLAAASRGRALSPSALAILEDCRLVSLRHSAFGCLPKGASPARPLAALRTERDGEIGAAPRLRVTGELPARRTVGPRPVRPITRRELEVSALVGEGLGNGEVGARLGKLGARSRLEIGLFAMRHRLKVRAGPPPTAQRAR